MRIRKHAKISGFTYTYTNLPTETFHQNNLCQLNQSPWDIITFPSPDSSSSFHQFDNYEVCYNVDYVGNGNSIYSVSDYESVDTMASGSGENCDIVGRKNDYDEVIGFKKERKKNKVEKELKLCDRLDAKGWQCGSVVKNGNTMCDSHLSELQSYNVLTTKKKLGPTSGCRPPHPKKRPKTNPHEFYYYTGFGPCWGKKRGTQATTSGIDDNMDDVQDEMGKERSEVKPMEVDCFYDDDNEDENEKGESGITRKKKGRKPVKERSLKSLM